MKPSKSRWFATLLLGGSLIGGPGLPTVLAQDTRAITEADKQRDKMYQDRLRAIQNDPTLTPQQRTDQTNALLNEWGAAKRQTSGIVGEMNRVTSQIDANQRSQPGFWDKVGDKAIDIVGELLKMAITNWMNKPTEENLRRIEELQRERDRLLNERNNPTPGTTDNGAGRPVYDSNGNLVGWDRDGDGRPDFTDTNGDGRPDSFNGGSYGDGYGDSGDFGTVGGNGGVGGSNDLTSSGGSSTNRPVYDPATGALLGFDTNGDGRVDVPAPAGATPPGGFGGGGGGGASLGAPFGGGFGGGGGGAGMAGPGGGDALARTAGEGGTPTGEGGKVGKEGGANPSATSPSKGSADDRTLATKMGRVIVLPKPEPTEIGARAGDRKPGAGPSDDWNDSADNGDRKKPAGAGNGDWGDDWGDDWGGGAKPARPAPGAPPASPEAKPAGTSGDKTAKLVDELIRVETVIAEWRKLEKDRKDDPNGVREGRAGFEGTKPGERDPLAGVRTPEGKIDVSKVEIWVVERDSWKEGEEPKRYRVKLSADALDEFDPIHGGYVVVRGVVAKLELDRKVVDEIGGSVEELEIVQVVLSSDTPPANDMAEPAPGKGKSVLDDDDNW